MALLKPKELRAMRIEDVRSKFKELSDELMHERGVAAMGGAPASPGKIRALRTNVARIHTVMREMEMAEAKKKPAEKKEGKPKEKKEKEKAAKPKKEEKK
jgi:large subunit ribosomal protein L29